MASSPTDQEGQSRRQCRNHPSLRRRYGGAGLSILGLVVLIVAIVLAFGLTMG